MEDFMDETMENPQDQYNTAIARIEELRKLQRTTPPGSVYKTINQELQQLEQQKEMLEQFYSFTETVAPELEISGEDTPWLQHIKDTFVDIWNINSGDQDYNSFLYYLRYFEHHMVPLFSRRYLHLDLKNSYERDLFYDLFLQLARELSAIEDEIAFFEKKELQGDERAQAIQRLRKLKNELYVKFNSQLQQISSFVKLILNDIYSGGNICLNKDQCLEARDFEQVTELSGLEVQEALEKVADFTKEAISFLNIPDF